MDKVSILIPSRNEPYLVKTLKDILQKAEEEIEIFVNIDGEKPQDLITDKRITYFYHPEPIGMRGGINLCLKYAKGKYLMKTDAHCKFAKGFDKALKKDMQEDWLVIPRRYSLNGFRWKVAKTDRFRDYHYLCYPVKTDWGHAMFPLEWHYTNELLIDDTMIFQGSCWFANRKYFMKRVGYLDHKSYGQFGTEQIEIGLKYWLKGGQVKVNKKTWYAHFHKEKRYYYEVLAVRNKSYKKSPSAIKGRTWATKHWMNNKEPDMIHPFSWLIEKFNPPNWPEDRKKWTI